MRILNADCVSFLNVGASTYSFPVSEPVDPERDLERRVTNLEAEVTHLRDDVARSASDAAAACVLAAGADRDVSGVRAELRAHTSALNALRETQLEMQRSTTRQFGELVGEVNGRFERVDAGTAQTTALLNVLIDRDAS